MWKCLYIYAVKNKRLPFVGLYENSGTRRVVRLLEVAKATDYTGTDTKDFIHVPAARPDKVFRTLFLSEGDPHFTLQIVDSPNGESPDLGIDHLRQELADD